MKSKNFIIIIFIIVVLLFSCNKKKENTGENARQKTEQANISGPIINTEAKIKSGLNEPATEEEKEMMKEFIYKNDDYYKIHHYSINYIEKANFGIPEGDNWIVKLNDMCIFIYVINDDKIIKDYYATIDGLNFRDQNFSEISEYDIIRDIPGTHIPDGVVSFGDFNGDGIIEIFSFIYSYLVGYNIDIFYYDSQKEGFVYCRIPYSIIDSKNGPSPVEFITYQGKLGFKVYNKKYHWETETTEEGKWYFYTWDAEKKEYIEIGEIVE